MKPCFLSVLSCCAIAVGAIPVPASAINVVFDYSYDLATDNFFNNNAAAKLALEQAGADISAAITSSLSAISPTGTPNVNLITGTSGSTSATADWQYQITNPSTGATENFLSPTVAANEVRIYVGMRELTGSTLGTGGPSGAGASLGFSGFNGQVQSAVNDLQTKSNQYMGRGSGPTIGTLNSGGVVFGETISYSLSYGVGIANLWFDNDKNNDGTADANVGDYWHFDHTTSVATGKSDFYSVALHEILHSIGIGASDSWGNNISGTDPKDWTGANVIALRGALGGNDVISSGGDHIANGLMSWNIYNGAAQEVAMDPDITTGTRKYLTELDLAFLRDIGWSTIVAVPEPSRALLATFGLLLMVMKRRRK